MYDIHTSLAPQHVRELLELSAVDPAVIAERGYETVMRPTINDQRPRQMLRDLGIPSWALGSPGRDAYTDEDGRAHKAEGEDAGPYPGLLIPMYRATGEKTAHIWKPASPRRNRDGKPMKYVASQGRASVIDVHPRWARGGRDDIIPPIRNTTIPLHITEGVKKADSLTSRGLCTAALSGVYNWRSTLGSLGDWEDIPLRDRDVTIIFDADARTNPAVLKAMRRLGRWLKSKGARPRYCIPPTTFNGRDSKGADDFFAAGGTVEQLLGYTTNTPPEELRGEDMYTDARMVETVADGCLEGDFLYTTGFGWVRWDGRRWARVDPGDVREAVRQYVLDRYVEALGELRDAANRGENTTRFELEVDGWHKFQTGAKLDTLVRIAADLEVLKRDAADFDVDPDLLVCLNGVLDLATGDLLAHSSERLVTRCTAAAYQPEAQDDAWDTVLKAIPDGAEAWLQQRLGQAITGHVPDDERMVMLTGGGGNGKTTLMNAVFEALGGASVRDDGHAVNVPSELLLLGKNPGGATPEKMTLRGARLGYVEETPENRHLDVEALKKVVGTPSIKGRHLYKDLVTFGATHSLFLNTNYPPIVGETDDGTWRRLVRIDFPYRFVAPGQPLAEPHHRHGLPDLKRRLSQPGALEAALAWLVEGARKWYANGMVFPGAQEDPACVRMATETWRLESDVVMQFIRDELEFDAGSWVPTTILFDKFKEWAAAKGLKGWTARTFLQRLRTIKGVTYSELINLGTYGAKRSVPTSPTWSAQGYAPKAGRTREPGAWGLRWQ